MLHWQQSVRVSKFLWKFNTSKIDWTVYWLQRYHSNHRLLLPCCASRWNRPHKTDTWIRVFSLVLKSVASDALSGSDFLQVNARTSLHPSGKETFGRRRHLRSLCQQPASCEPSVVVRASFCVVGNDPNGPILAISRRIRTSAHMHFTDLRCQHDPS